VTRTGPTRLRLALSAGLVLAGTAGLAASAGAAPAPAAARAAPAAAPRALSLVLNGAITSGTAEYVEAGLARARAEGFDVVALTLDTPGGELNATRDVVQRMLASEVPIVVWVGPAGARAGSAGVFITIAAHVAGMHPASNIGAAHPVSGGGRDVEESGGKEMARKVENDTAAFARSIAAARGRNADWAEKAVRESVSVTAEEAARLKVVDAVSADLPALLAVADGRSIELAGKKATIRARDATVVAQQMTIRQRTLAFLADPNVAAILMLVGTLGIALELYHPGSFVPGIAGALCLLLAFLAMRIIPVNAGAVALLLAGMALVIAEAYLPTHGIAGIAGTACMVVGTLLFIDRGSPEWHFDPEGLRVSPLVVWPTPIAIGALLAFVGWKVVGSRRAPLVAGAPGLVGERGHALSDVGPVAGEVFVHGEYWQARAASPIPKGAAVRVSAVRGLVVDVVADDRAPR
jgi:membrane-bound serine protease (ClpP class)